MKRTLGFFTSCFLLIFSGSVCAQEFEKQIASEIENYVDVRKGGLASVAVSVFQNESTVYENYFGMADIENSVPADGDTVYEWGSVSKMLVWTSAMQLYEQEKLDLNEDVRTYLPTGFLTKLHYEEPVTMLHLMNHTAGFQECVYQNESIKEEKLLPLEKTLRNLEPNQVFRPGTVMSYSNWGAALAAFIVQCVSGEDYVDYVHHHILEPLGMTQTAVSGSHRDNLDVKERRENLKTYNINSEENDSFGINVSYVDVYPAGAVISPLCDLVKFGKAFVPSDGKSPLFQKSETLKEMLSASLFYGDTNAPRDCHGLLVSYYGKTVFGHGGNTAGCTSNLLFDPETGKGIAVIVNEVGETAFTMGLPSLLFGEYKDNPYFGEGSKSSSKSTPDISGFYTESRSFIKGFYCMAQYTFFLPVAKMNEDGKFPIIGGMGGIISDVGNSFFILDNQNGMQMPLYLSRNEKERNVLQMECYDYIHDPTFFVKAAFIILVPVLALIAFIVILVQMIKFVARKKSRNLSNAKSLSLDKKSVAALMAKLTPIVITIIVLLFFSSSICVKPFAVISAILAGFLALSSVANGVYLIRKKCLFSALCALYSAFFICYFQFWNFWGV